MRTCEVCGADISTKRSDAIYCSKVCKGKARNPGPSSKVCLWCGSPMPPSRGATALYCNRKCRDAQYRGTYKEQRTAGIKRWRTENADHIKQYSADYYVENREAIAARDKARYEADPAKAQAWATAWKQNNVRRVREYYQIRYWNNPGHYRQLALDYAKEHPIEMAQRQRLRQALIKDAGPLIPQAEWDKLVRRLGNRCVYCRKTFDGDLTMDHVVPLTRQGRNTIGNVVPACRSCNSSKSDSFLIEWRHSGLAPEGPFLVA